MTLRAARAGSLHRRRFGIPRCSALADGQVSLAKSDCDGAVQPLLHPHAGFTQSADNRLALDLIELGIQRNGGRSFRTCRISSRGLKKPPGCGSSPVADARRRSGPAPLSTPVPTTPDRFLQGIGSPVRGTSLRPLACLSPDDPAPFRSSSPRALSPADCAPLSRRFQFPQRASNLRRRASPRGLCLLLGSSRRLRFSAVRKDTGLVRIRKVPAVARTSPDNSSAASCSLRSCRAARTRQTSGWCMRHRSSRSGDSFSPRLPASRAQAGVPLDQLSKTAPPGAPGGMPQSPSAPSARHSFCPDQSTARTVSLLASMSCLSAADIPAWAVGPNPLYRSADRI